MREALYPRGAAHGRARRRSSRAACAGSTSAACTRPTSRRCATRCGARRRGGRCCCLSTASRCRPRAFDQRHVVDGDATSAAIAAASVIAKVTRDRFMQPMPTRATRAGSSPPTSATRRRSTAPRSDARASRRCTGCPSSRWPTSSSRSGLAGRPCTDPSRRFRHRRGCARVRTPIASADRRCYARPRRASPRQPSTSHGRRRITALAPRRVAGLCASTRSRGRRVVEAPTTLARSRGAGPRLASRTRSPAGDFSRVRPLDRARSPRPSCSGGAGRTASDLVDGLSRSRLIFADMSRLRGTSSVAAARSQPASRGPGADAVLASPASCARRNRASTAPPACPSSSGPSPYFLSALAAFVRRPTSTSQSMVTHARAASCRSPDAVADPLAPRRAVAHGGAADPRRKLCARSPPLAAARYALGTHGPAPRTLGTVFSHFPTDTC